MQTIFLGDARFHTGKESGKAPPTKCAVAVSKPLVAKYVSRYSVEWRRHRKRQEICVGICWRDETSLNSMARGRVSSAAAFSTWSLDLRDGWDLSQPEQGDAIHFGLQFSRPWWFVTDSLQNWHGKSKNTTTSVCHIQNVLRQHLCCYFSFRRDGSVTIVAPADVFQVESTIGTNSPEIAAEMNSRCNRDGQMSQGDTREDRAEAFVEDCEGSCRQMVHTAKTSLWKSNKSDTSGLPFIHCLHSRMITVQWVKHCYLFQRMTSTMRKAPAPAMRRAVGARRISSQFTGTRKGYLVEETILCWRWMKKCRHFWAKRQSFAST